jgi:hypothetical protein
MISSPVDRCHPLREWAYTRAYQNSDQRSAELVNSLDHYNRHRPHGSLKTNTPIGRPDLSEDNLAPQLARVEDDRILNLGNEF